MKVEVRKSEIRVCLEPGMVARFDGGVAMVGNMVVARVVVRNFAGGGFDLRPVVEPGAARLPLNVRGSLEEAAQWVARHPEALACRPIGRGLPAILSTWPFVERVEALAVRDRDPVTGAKVQRVVRPAGFRRHPYYRSLSGPVGRLP